jgi:hypothetical protein
MGALLGQVLYDMIGAFSAFWLSALLGQVLYDMIGAFSAFWLNLPQPTPSLPYSPTLPLTLLQATVRRPSALA